MKIEPDDFITQKEPDTKKTIKIIGVSIVITVVILMIIIIAIASIKPEAKLSLLVNGKAVSFKEDTFVSSEDRKNLRIYKRCCTTCWL